ncbi:hypothetical protein B0H17DRAFT_847338, partial [Mycena rosella]
FSFSPSQITAANGTVVTFQFTGVPGNHSVTQSSFASPCQPLDGGFDSGWIFVNTTSDTPPEWSVTITDDSKPIWFYCKSKGPTARTVCNLLHLCDAGCMVGVINVKNGTNTFDAFQAAAKSDKAPGQAQGGLVGVGASASAEPFVPSGA